MCPSAWPLIGPTACLINMGGILLEVFTTYLLGRFLGGNRVEQLLRKKKGGEKLLNLDLQDKPGFIFLVRFVPAFPIDFTSLSSAHLQSHGFFPLYLLMSLLGLAPRVIAFTILGDQILRPDSHAFCHHRLRDRHPGWGCGLSDPTGCEKKESESVRKQAGGQRKKCVSAACFFVPFFACGWAGHAV